MTNESWGTKRNCPSCAAHFYDLNKMPAHCPKCQHEFDPNAVVRARRKPVRKDAADKKDAAQGSVLPTKKISARKKNKDVDADGINEGGMSEIAEIEDVDDIENLQELSELEEREESPLNSDDADDESIIDDMDTTGKVLVDNIEDEEAEALVGELDEEEAEPDTKKGGTAKKSK